MTAAQDATVTLWPGTAAAQTVSSSTDTFANLVQGVTVTVAKPTAAPVTLTSTMDSASITSTASSLVSGVNTLLSYISQQSAVTTTQNTDGSSTTTAGTFTGSLLIQGVYRNLQSAVSAPVGPGGTVSPATYGIAIQSDGSIKFDSAKFQAALASDPAGTMAAVQICCVGGVVAAHFMGAQLLRLIYGPAFAGEAPLLTAAAIAAGPVYCASIASISCYAANLRKGLLSSQVVVFVTLLVATMILLPRWGNFGAIAGRYANRIAGGT